MYFFLYTLSTSVSLCTANGFGNMFLIQSSRSETFKFAYSQFSSIKTKTFVGSSSSKIRNLLLFFVIYETSSRSFSVEDLAVSSGAVVDCEPVFGLTVLGYCRNMSVQHGGLHGRGPAPSGTNTFSFELFKMQLWALGKKLLWAYLIIFWTFYGQNTQITNQNTNLQIS